MNRIGILALGKKGLTSLKALKDQGFLSNLQFVVVGTDPSIKNDYSADILEFCTENNINTYSRYEFEKEKPESDYVLAIGWRWLLDSKDNTIVTIHDSLLPKYRGYNPLVTSLIEGDELIGATAILANDEMDAGDIIFQESVKIRYPIKIADAINLISKVYASIVIKIFKSSRFNTHPQKSSEATYSLWRNEDDYLIDWSKDSSEIVRFVDAVGFPYLGASTSYDNRKILVTDSEMSDDFWIVNRTPGKLFKIEKNIPSVVCGTGIIKIRKALYLDNNEPVIFNRLRVKLE